MHQQLKQQLKNMDSKEIELPETVFIRDIETRVFQGIALQALAKVEGIALLEGNLLDSLLGREVERVRGIHVEQSQEKQAVDCKIELNILYGLSIPEKAEEIQNKVVEEITRWTGLHVASVHIIFKDLILPPPPEEEEAKEEEGAENPAAFEEAF